MKKVLVTGSRSWRNEAIIRAALKAEAVGFGSDVVLLSGNCSTGADAIAERIWSRAGGEVILFPADWNTYGRRAGYVRNSRMIDEEPDVLLAFLSECKQKNCSVEGAHDSHGASGMIALARKKNIVVKIFREEKNG